MINEEVDPEKNSEKFLNDFFERFAAQLHLDTFVHYTWDKASRNLRLASCRGLSPAIEKNIATLAFDRSIEDLLVSKDPFCLDVWISEPVNPLGELMTMLKIKAHVCCPLIAHGHFHGIICFGSSERIMFSDEELSLFQSLCAVVMAIERVRQFSTFSMAGPCVNRGSEIAVRLPLTAEPASGANPPGPARLKLPAEYRRNVLVVEDNVDSAQSMGELLELWGHEVHLSYNGPAAVSEALRYRPDVILLDIGLPGMDGYHVAEALRRQNLFSSVLIVAVTGYGQAEDQRRSREVGIDYHLIKPIDLSELRGLLEGRGQTHYQIAG